MVDLREKVEGDRGTLKKIQTHVPGFAGYRRMEDIRAADSLLRLQLADRLVTVRKKLEDARAVLVENYSTQNLDKLGTLIMKFKAVEGDVRHAEQGYSGISATIRIEERQLDLLYEYDYSMITHVASMEGTLGNLKTIIGGGDSEAVKGELERVRSWLDAFQENFRKRMKVITGTEVA
jgi:hypothetical protein